ncbi:hypothetical protein [uncultured Planktosalinus sp.]|uniref:hypothetical protein n=1 Tax=uncultured Planktosalinus sp. TaxID=1810935 RepID=UPI0030D7587D
MRIYFLITLLVCFTVVSCAEGSQKETSSESKDLHQGTQEGYLNLKLDNSSKWQANIETTEGVKEMQKLVSTFIKENSNDYIALKEQLEANFAYIFEKCTMKGESHDQLHNYLYPMKILFEDLTKDQQTAQQAVIDLQQHIPVYFQYFE